MHDFQTPSSRLLLLLITNSIVCPQIHALVTHANEITPEPPCFGGLGAGEQRVIL